MSATVLHPDGLHRCPWPRQDDPVYVNYHDNEWGLPEYDDRALYEKLVLDGFQAGLSWITILRKRDNFRRAFDGFVPDAGLPVMAGEKQVGVTGSHAGNRGLAMLRLDRVADARAAGLPLVAGGVTITPEKPDWATFAWPGEKT